MSGELVEAEATLLTDGRLRAPRQEHFALLLADEISMADAWKAVGGQTKGESIKYRAKVMRQPNFQKRVEALKAEKIELELDEIFGPVEWELRQAYRLALIQNDLRTLKEAVAMRLDVVKQKLSWREKMGGLPIPPPPTDQEAEEPAPDKNPVGRPAAAQKHARSTADVRRELVALGVKPPEPVEDDA